MVASFLELGYFLFKPTDFIDKGIVLFLRFLVFQNSFVSINDPLYVGNLRI